MPRAKAKKKTVFTKNYIREAQVFQGTWESYVKERERLKAEGVPVDRAWQGALDLFPIAEVTHIKLRELRREKNRKAKVSDGDLAEAGQQVRQERRQAVAAVPIVESHTGIPLVDWLYANLELDEPLTPPAAAGDLGLFDHYRRNKEDFYHSVFMPALLKKHRVEKPAESEGEVLDASRQSTEELLETLRDVHLPDAVRADGPEGDGGQPELAEPAAGTGGQEQGAASPIAGDVPA